MHELVPGRRASFQLFFRFESFDGLGRRVRVTEVTSRPRLIKGDNPETPDFVEPYYLSGDGTNKVVEQGWLSRQSVIVDRRAPRGPHNHR